MVLGCWIFRPYALDNPHPVFAFAVESRYTSGLVSSFSILVLNCYSFFMSIVTNNKKQESKNAFRRRNKGKGQKKMRGMKPPIKFGAFRLADFKDRKVELAARENDELLIPASAVARSLVDPRQIYGFRLVATGLNVSTSVAGVMNGNFTFSPSVTTWSEYSTLQVLFNEVRLRWVKMIWVNINPHSDGYALGPVKSYAVVNMDPGLASTNPTNEAGVLENPCSKIVSLSTTRTQELELKFLQQEFAQTGTPAPGPYAGCYGEMQFINDNALTASTTYATVFLEGGFEFTSRT